MVSQSPNVECLVLVMVMLVGVTSKPKHVPWRRRDGITLLFSTCIEPQINVLFSSLIVMQPLSIMWFHFVSQVDSKGVMLVGIKLVEPERSRQVACGGSDGPGLQAAFLLPHFVDCISVLWSLPPTAQAIALSSEEEEMGLLRRLTTLSGQIYLSHKGSLKM